MQGSGSVLLGLGMRKLFWFVGASPGYVVMCNLGVHVNFRQKVCGQRIQDRD